MTNWCGRKKHVLLSCFEFKNFNFKTGSAPNWVQSQLGQSGVIQSPILPKVRILKFDSLKKCAPFFFSTSYNSPPSFKRDWIMVTNLHVEEGNKFLLFSFTTTNLPIQATTKMQLQFSCIQERNFTFFSVLDWLLLRHPVPLRRSVRRGQR